MNKHYTNENNPLENFSLDPEDRLVHATSKRQSLFKASKGSKQKSEAEQDSTALLNGETISSAKEHMPMEQNVQFKQSGTGLANASSPYINSSRQFATLSSSFLQPTEMSIALYSQGVYKQQNTLDEQSRYQQQNNSDVQKVSSQFAYKSQSQQSYQNYSQMQQQQSQEQELAQGIYTQSNTDFNKDFYAPSNAKFNSDFEANSHAVAQAKDDALVQDRYYSAASIVNTANSDVGYNTSTANSAVGYNTNNVQNSMANQSKASTNFHYFEKMEQSLAQEKQLALGQDTAFIPSEQDMLERSKGNVHQSSLSRISEPSNSYVGDSKSSRNDPFIRSAYLDQSALEQPQALSNTSNSAFDYQARGAITASIQEQGVLAAKNGALNASSTINLEPSLGNSLEQSLGQAQGASAENFSSSFNRTVDSAEPFVQSKNEIDADDNRVSLNSPHNMSLTQDSKVYSNNEVYGNQAPQFSVEVSQLENKTAQSPVEYAQLEEERDRASNGSKQPQEQDNQDIASHEQKVESVDNLTSRSTQDSHSQNSNLQEIQQQGNFLYQWREQRRAEKKAREEYKAAIKSGAIPKPSFFKRVGHAFASLFSLGWKMGIAGLCVCIGLFIYFDSVVISQYEVDDKWVLPAVVYSRPLELYPDQRLSLEQMVYELKLLKYREVSSPRRQGEYAVNKENGRIVLIKRQFQFPEGEEPAMSVMVEFDDKRVSRILNADTQQELGYMRMDPVLLDRINRINPQEDRIFINIDEVPKELITTLIEIEDRSYYSHIGVNPMAIARAFVKNLMAGGVVEGGSTITQQLVKNYFLTNERSYSRKLKEIFMAISMNHRYTKDQILEAYMNEIYLGQNGNAGIYGFGLASYFYFGVPVAELSLDQMALLVGLIKGPSYYDPWRHPEKALERRNTVLAVLRNRDLISSERFELESQKPLNVIARGQLNYSKTPAFMGLVKTEIGYRFKEEEERTGKDFLSGNGIRIFTSLDPQAQVAAEKAVQTEIAAIEKERKLKGLEAAMIVSSWRTGEVSAVVGSSNPKFDGYNRVLDSRRQVGSLIKPFVYLTAFHQGYHLGSIVNDSPVKVKLPNGDVWSPKNDDKRFRGPIRVIRAMASSLNVPTVRIGMGSGLDNVINTLHAAGFKRKLDMYPSIVLGTPEISPYELNSMYAGMATEGIYRDLTTLRTVVKNGEIVYQRGSNRGERTLDPKDTYLAIYGMTEATRSGTGRKIHAAFPDVTIASKTGTTNDFRDSWTVGMDSDELSTVWVGFDNNKSTGLYGATGAMRLYIAYLKERGVNSLVLKKPEGVAFVNFDKQGNVLASGCEEPGMENFPAREDRIQFIKQCNNFGESGYEELPYDVPNRPVVQDANQQTAWPNMQPSLNTQPALNSQPYPSVPNSSNMQMGNQSNVGGQNAVGQSAYPQTPMPQGALIPPNQDALQSSSVEDSKAKDVQPITPDMNARPTQSSSSNIERQADSFEDQLLGL